MIDTLLSRDWLPDFALRFGIRRLLAQRLRDEALRYDAARYVADLKTRGIAEQTAAANEQHYEVPTAFYQFCLGKRLKYSGCLYATGNETLDQAEEAMLDLYAQRARLANGQDILELGCGWGSLSLWMAEHFPGSRITGVSNSRTQKEFIDAEAARRGLKNLTIVTCDMNVFQADKGAYDRIVSVEMFEHMKNYEALFEKVASWMKPDALLFIHIFTHQRYSYHFEARDASDWMSRYFFTGGQMPADDLFTHFQKNVKLEDHWIVNGRHYQQTAEHWLENMDRHKASIMPLFEKTYGAENATRWWVYWRVFYMACAELWGYRKGQEWLVSHYLFSKKLT